eukprot:3608707-Karenia_brevis.AAC.1
MAIVKQRSPNALPAMEPLVVWATLLCPSTDIQVQVCIQIMRWKVWDLALRIPNSSRHTLSTIFCTP